MAQNNERGNSKYKKDDKADINFERTKRIEKVFLIKIGTLVIYEIITAAANNGKLSIKDT